MAARRPRDVDLFDIDLPRSMLDDVTTAARRPRDVDDVDDANGNIKLTPITRVTIAARRPRDVNKRETSIDREVRACHNGCPSP